MIHPGQEYIKYFIYMYRQISNTRRTLEGNIVVDDPDVIGASHVGAAPTSSSYST